MKMLKCHCKSKLKKKKVKGRTNVFVCPKCGCTYGLVIARMSNECARAITPAPKFTLAELRKQRRKRKKKRKSKK